MSILVDQSTKVLIQGITGQSGKRFAQNMSSYFSKPLAGVTPGKASQSVDGIPVFNSVKEALEVYPEINFSSINVPPASVKEATLEAMDAGLKKIFIYAERVPIQDSLEVMRYAEKHCVQIIGPNSPGIISPGKGRIGAIGGTINYLNRVFMPGVAGVVSRSGGMTTMVSWLLTDAGIGQSTALGCGGDPIIGSPIKKLYPMFLNDPETKVVVLFAEVGTSYEEDFAAYLKREGMKKPVVAFIAGRHALPEFRYGHAGAIIEGNTGTWQSKYDALCDAGVLIARSLSDIAILTKKSI
ncbi:MAG: succinate--CoA ligase subunit alpha [Anaerolineaceae bacterium]|nr:succinate--CoA ligase subunit alpha [Anaerolineaceae bacterium]